MIERTRLKVLNNLGWTPYLFYLVLIMVLVYCLPRTENSCLWTGHFAVLLSFIGFIFATKTMIVYFGFAWSASINFGNYFSENIPGWQSFWMNLYHFEDQWNSSSDSQHTVYKAFTRIATKHVQNILHR